MDDFASVELQFAGLAEISRARSTSELIEGIKSNARQAIGCDGVCFVLKDADLCYYAAEDAVGPLWEGRRFPSEACVSGWSMRTGNVAVIPDIFEDDRVPHAIYRQTFVRSLVMAPAGEPARAAIGAYWQDRNGPSETAIRILIGVAASVGAALDRIGSIL